MPDESAEDEDVDVPSSRQQEYANAVLDQLDDGNSGSVKSSDCDQPWFKLKAARKFADLKKAVVNAHVESKRAVAANILELGSDKSDIDIDMYAQDARASAQSEFEMDRNRELLRFLFDIYEDMVTAYQANLS